MFHSVHAVLHNVFQQTIRRCEVKLHRGNLCFTLCYTVQLILHSASYEFVFENLIFLNQHFLI